ALVLSGGGARGIAHIGVIEELLLHGYTIRSVAGTSMGALIGGIYAQGNLTEFREWLLTITRMEILKFIDLTTVKGGMVKGEKIVQAINRFIGDVNIEDLNIPYTAIAVDLNRHAEVVFSSGRLMEAIRASISIPTVFLPVKKDDALLVDGGVMNPLPIDRVLRHDGDILIAVNVNANLPYAVSPKNHEHAEYEKGYRGVIDNLNSRWSELFHYSKKSKVNHEKPVGMFEVIAETLNLMQDRLMQDAVEKYKPDILIQVSNRMSTIFDFYKAELIMEEGRKACRKALSEVEVYDQGS
ncbi:MAG TPA: patatin-like phospholipase family protein, partial [Bacteroidales bacterium]|nr:patatin-like phospholipase family protein [Bacteroidales bacterium]